MSLSRPLMKRLSKVIQADFGQGYSYYKFRRVSIFPITWWSCFKAFVLPLVVPVLVDVSLTTLIPLDDPHKGFRGKNLGVMVLTVIMPFITALTFDLRMASMIPKTHLNRTKRAGCVVASAGTMILSCTIAWSMIAFPFPFGTYQR